MYITGTSSLVIFSLESKKDLWLGILISYLMAVIMCLMIGRIKYSFPEKDFFEIIEDCLGMVISKIFLIIYILSAFYICVLINSFLIHFINATALPNTPKVALAIPITFLCIWMVKEGVELICRFATIFILPTMFSIAILTIMLTPNMNITNLLPPFQENIGKILHGALSTFIFPLGEVVVFSAFFKKFSNKKASYKVLLTGTSIGSLIVLIISVTNVLVLGIKLASDTYYPTYVSASRITIGNYVRGLEVILSTAFILGAFVKSTVYFTICCKAVSRTFGFKDNYKFIITPIGLLLLCSSLFFYDGPLDYTQWLKKNLVPYSIPYVIIIPIIIFIISEFKNKKTHKSFK
jgi:spore germination protein KB